MMKRLTGRGAGLLVVVSLLLAACGGDGPQAGAPAGGVPHGYVEGAEETAETQSRLIVADAGTGLVHVVDLITEQVVPAGRVDGVRGITGDGRFGYLTGRDGSVRVVDSGSWMVDHGDHVHYYRAPVREVGVVPGIVPSSGPGAGPVAAYSDPAVTAVSFPNGTTSLLDRAKLDKGSVAELATIARTAHLSTAVPYRERVLASVADPGQRHARGVRVHDRQGNPVAEVAQPCPELQGQAVTRRGVVFGCADGALLVTEKDGAFTGEKIPYPRQVDPGERAIRFTHRPGSSTLTAPAGDSGAWLLDTARRTWRRIETGPLAAVNAVGEGAPLLALTRDGILRAYDTTTGAERARTQLMAPEATTLAAAPSIQIDNTRAYVNNPSSGQVYEIDYNDGLRRARTLTVGGKASHIVETGR
ncbi:hypothetical protein EV193_11519 [Herbihabitans rhizosphaerae]|uniref:Lipoprotein n=1 Tax=Herbihabitans rhizosphaerae TaxID=1872711 RepID=A0A4Q7KE80_9PSEU|nr:hypothetical protein [Herbihabitans rhizosphaerae]RZS31140.1 hypothetical protein EV193_11519 [Herbihabitans rhizosphaerae]